MCEVLGTNSSYTHTQMHTCIPYTFYKPGVVVHAPKRQRQEDHHTHKIRLVYLVSSGPPGLQKEPLFKTNKQSKQNKPNICNNLAVVLYFSLSAGEAEAGGAPGIPD